MKAEVRQRLSEEVEDFWKTTQIERSLNEGIKRFCHEEQWPWLFTTRTGLAVVQNQSTIDFEQDVEATRHHSLALTDGTTALHLLRKVAPGHGMRLRREFFNRKGTPQFYYIESIVETTGPPQTLKYRMRLVPSADKAYTAEYTYLREPATLVADTDEADIPETYMEAPIAWATGMMWLKELSGGGKAQEQFNIYDSVLQQAKRDMNTIGVDEVLVWGKQVPEPRDRLAFPHLPQNI